MRLYQRTLINQKIGGGSTGTTYYVDPVNGSDANAGTSTGAPWKTASKVNAANSYNGGGLQAGQSVLFKGGTTISGSIAFIQGGNVKTSLKTNPITIGSYGSGVATISPTQTGPFTFGLLTDGVSGIVIQNLNIIASANNIQYGVKYQNSGGAPSGTASGFSLINCFVCGFNTTNNSPSAEIAYMGYIDGPGIVGAIDSILIKNCVACGTGLFSTDDTGIYGRPAVSPGFLNVTNVIVEGCQVYYIGGRPNSEPYGGGSGNGILTSANGALVQYNVSHDNCANVSGTSGGGGCNCWMVNCLNGVMQYNESYNSRPWPNFTNGEDFDGFDLDGGCQNCIFRFNYSHDNFGASIIGFISTGDFNNDGNGTGGWGPNWFYGNIVVGDMYGVADRSAGCLGFGGPGIGGSGYASTAVAYVYNNTVINNADGATFGPGGRFPNINFPPLNTMFMNNNTGSGGGKLTSGSIVANNLFYQTPGQYGEVNFYYDPYDVDQVLFLNNAYVMSAAASGVGPTWVYNNGSDGVATSSFATWQSIVAGHEVGGFLSSASPGFNSSGTSGVGSWTPASLTGPNSWGPTAYDLTAASTFFRGKGLNLNTAYGLPTPTQDYFGRAFNSNGLGTGWPIGASSF
jgi:hypothetical protein